MTDFQLSAIEACGGPASLAATLNEQLDDLRRQRIKTVPLVGQTAGDLLVWQVAMLRQAILHRGIALAEGCVGSLNGRLPLPAILCARAAIETAALATDFKLAIAKAARRSDYEKAHEELRKRIHGTRLEDWIEDGAGAKAVNVLTMIDTLEAEMTRRAGQSIPVREIYEAISEWCHPNFLGTAYMFRDLDPANTSSPVATFAEDLRYDVRTLRIVAVAMHTLELMGSELIEIDDLVPTLRTLRPRVPGDT